MIHYSGLKTQDLRLLEKSFSKIVVLTDSNTTEYCLPVFTKALNLSFQHISILAGEKSKNLENASYIWNQLLEIQADRNALLVNLGGGMICDIGGFCAATYKRGLSFMNVPTTLLAMIDAAVGGKTGINLGHYKNQVGLFATSEAIIIDPVFLHTLPAKELSAGFSEALKYGLIYKQELWHELKEMNPPDIISNSALIDECIKIKEEIVSKDPKEKGLRKILNFGHTIGHAIESYSLENYEAPLLHGEAIAIGMIAEAYLSHKKMGLPKAALDEISLSLNKIFKRYTFEKPSYDDLYHYMLNDKKNVNEEVRFVLLKNIGEAVYDISCSFEEIGEALDYYLELNMQ